MNNIKKYFSKKNIILILLLTVCLTISFSYCSSYFITSGRFSITNSIKILKFIPKVNDSSNMSQTIDLSTTITNDKTLSPGAEGKFKIDIDLSEVEFNSYYMINFDNTDLPENLHFYVDENFTSELTTIEGVQYLDDYNKVAEHYIYWKWDYLNNETANSNDNLFMDKEIIVPFEVRISARVNKNTILVNGIEKPTGRVNLIGSEGSFDLNLDFKNLSRTNYKIHFNISDISNNLHLYSDSSFVNEITDISDIYDGVNNEVTKTIYYRFDESLNPLTRLYYIVYLP